MLSPKTKRNISRVIPYGVLWFIFSLIYCVLEKSILGYLNHYPSTGVQYNFARSITIIPVVGVMMGMITGVLEIGYLSKWLLKRSFIRKIIFKSIIYLLIVVVFLVTIPVINMLSTRDKHSIDDLSSPAWAFFTDYALAGVMLYIASIIVITQFYAEFRESIGPGTLNNFFLGTYHHPIEEERIFMFVDMKSSTTIAESLGHVKYFQMLKEYFFDLSGSVIDHAGVIYQYTRWKFRRKNTLPNLAYYQASKRGYTMVW
jgi:adenylate cyclase